MRHLGKAMKIGNKNNDQESNTLKPFLIPYRQTPYPYIKLPSPEMIFRNWIKSSFSRHSVNSESVKTVTAKDNFHKQRNEEEINPSKYRKTSLFEIGVRMVIQSYKKSMKFAEFE